MPPVRSTARGWGRGRGRGRGAAVATAAASTWRKRAALDSDLIQTGNDGKSVLRTKRRIQESKSTVDDSGKGPRGAPEEVAHVSLKDRHALMDISNGVVDGEMEAVMEVSGREMKSVLHRRSKRLQGKPSRVQDLDGRDTDDDIPENSSSSSEDEEKKLAPLRSKRLRDTYKSEYASGETSADKDTSLSSYDDDHGILVPHRRSK